MSVDVNFDKRYIDIWLDRGEPTPDRSEIRQRFPGYQIAVFHSGSGDLAGLTAELLKVNV